ncbi:hypothetical protein PCAR4_10081 [Paraburkholderia caribensis]|nr:hypothetical protein PCAR4_10081 [Paraburkholderia caribensis]
MILSLAGGPYIEAPGGGAKGTQHGAAAHSKRVAGRSGTLERTCKQTAHSTYRLSSKSKKQDVSPLACCSGVS